MKIAGQFLDEDRRVDDLDLVAEFTVVVADRLHAVRARRQDLLRAGGFQVLDVRVREPLEHVLVAGALRRIARALLLRQHAEADAILAQNLEQRTQGLLEARLERARAAEPDEDVMLPRIEGLELRRLDELLPLVGAEPPDIAAPLEVVIDRAEILGRIAVGHEAAARSDQDRQGLDADRALVLARAACRALPQDFLGVHLAEFLPRLAGQQRVLRLENDLLRVQFLARAPRRAVHLAAPALDACKRVEDALAPEIFQRLETDLFLLEVQVRQV